MIRVNECLAGVEELGGKSCVRQDRAGLLLILLILVHASCTLKQRVRVQVTMST
jgi:hypothetical protein